MAASYPLNRYGSTKGVLNFSQDCKDSYKTFFPHMTVTSLVETCRPCKPKTKTKAFPVSIYTKIITYRVHKWTNHYPLFIQLSLAKLNSVQWDTDQWRRQRFKKTKDKQRLSVTSTIVSYHRGVTSQPLLCFHWCYYHKHNVFAVSDISK